MAAAAPAGAELGPLRLVSTSPQEQADIAVLPALSADGRYVAFAGSLDGSRGVFRKDLATGAVTLVAGGSAYQANVPGADATGPSISADGRYIAFTTSTALDPALDPGTGTSVYVRDMDAPAPAGGVCAPGVPCAYELASARDGSTHGLTYAAGGGAIATPRVALSADGRHVAFATSGTSDLTAATPGTTTTPTGQVAVRDLDDDATTLVSVARDPQTGAMEPGVPVPDGAVMPSSLGMGERLPGAALSADGTTVAWLGAHLPAQVPLLADEAQTISADDASPTLVYDEPLWRRIADGPLAPTRRIVGGGDPLAPGCPADGTLADPACRGPFPSMASSAFLRDSVTGWLGLTAFIGGVPQLSADGRTVALIGDPDGVANLFLADMHDGLTRQQALRQMTREVPLSDPSKAGSFETIPGAGDIVDAGISASGRRIAFATGRSQFPLAPPTLVGPPLGQLGLLELYRIDLDEATIERITQGPGGGPSLGPAGLTAQNRDGASAPSFSADGATLAFASSASNLVAGDANGASDVFAVSDVTLPDAPGTVEISPAPPAVRPKPLWRMAVTAFPQANGTVRLDVVVPGAGRLASSASAVLRVAVATRHGRRTRLASRRVASVAHAVKRDGLVALTLRAAKRYAALTRSRTGLEASVRVAFSGHGGHALHDTLDVTFHVKSKREKPVRR